MRESVDLALAIYPIGLKLYEHFGVNYEFVGHPLCAEVRPHVTWEALRREVGAAGDAPVIGLMPGSRREEVALIGRELVCAARLIAKKLPEAAFALPVALPGLRESLTQMAEEHSVDIALLEPERRYDLMSHADLMIVASGTATHECAIAGTPHIAVYRLKPLYDFLYATFTRFRMPAYAFPNIIAGRHVVPELMRRDCNRELIARTALALLADPDALARMRTDLAEVRRRICRPGTLDTAAKLIVEAARSRLR
jgi:lipid-A-disaccharide synthase